MHTPPSHVALVTTGTLNVTKVTPRTFHVVTVEVARTYKARTGTFQLPPFTFATEGFHHWRVNPIGPR